jgi:ketosteroid isomerase-like protein
VSKRWAVGEGYSRKQGYPTIEQAEVCALRASIMVALLACMGTAAAYAPTDSDADAAAKLIAMQHLWAQSYVNKDPKALDRILDDDFVNVDTDGKIQTKGEILAEVKTASTSQFITESMVVHLHGDTAIVTGVFLIKGVERGKPYAERNRFVDTWFRTKGHWESIAGLVTRVEP